MKKAVSASRAQQAGKTTAALFLALSLAAPLVVQPVLAQCNKRATVPPTITGNRKLSGPPSDFPLPMPQDAKFQFGYENQWTNSKPVTFMQLRSKAQPAQLAGWYEQVFRSQGYTVGKPSANRKGGTELSGRKGSAAVSIAMAPLRMGKEQLTTISIRYAH